MIIYNDKEKEINIPNGLGNVKVTINEVMDCPDLEEITIVENGIYEGAFDVVNVEVPSVELTTIDITKNGTYGGAFNKVNVNVADENGSYNEGFTDGVADQKSKLGIGYFAENGTYTNENGWKEVNVNVDTPTGGNSVFMMLTGAIKLSNCMLDGSQNLTIDISAVYDVENFFESTNFGDGYSPIIQGLETKGLLMSFFENSDVVNVQDLNTFSAENLSRMFYGCTSLVSLPLMDCSRVNTISNMFTNCSALKNVEGFLNLGQGFNNNLSMTLNLGACKNLTYQSLLNIINSLYDLNLNTEFTKTASISVVKAVGNLLSSEEKALITSKGWTLKLS